MVLDAAEVEAALLPFATVNARIPMMVAADGRKLKTDFAPRAVRRLLTTIEEHGPENVAVLIQGKLGA